MESLYQRLDPHVMVGELTDLGAEDMPQDVPYEDQSQNIKTFSYWMKNQR